MTTTIASVDLALRSHRSDWDRERWENLPADGNRYEIISGVLYMTTAPSAFHQWIVRQIVRVLFKQIDDAGVGVTLWAPIGVFMPGCDPVQPDVLVIRQEDLGMVQHRRVFGIPALLIEVLAPSNPKQDLDVKRDAYARAGVPEYWIIRPAERDVLIFSEPDQHLGLYKRLDTLLPTEDLVSPTLPIRTSVADLFAGAPDTTL